MHVQGISDTYICIYIYIYTNITISTCVCVAKKSVYSREISDSISATVVFVEANRTIALFNVMRASCHMVGFEVK